MAVQITVDQAAKPAGVAGKAREDLDTGVAATLTASGGVFLAYSWSIIHKPIDVFTSTKSTAALTAPASAVTNVTPLDLPGTYHVQVLVDSGSGLGATAADIARLTFYAGIPGDKFRGALATRADLLPRRIPAFQETTEHNVNDAFDPAGNLEGWSREWYRHFAVLQKLFEGRSWAQGRVALTGAGATLVRQFNVATVTRVGVGIVDVTFTIAMPDANYSVVYGARGAVGGQVVTTNELTTGFRATRSDLAGVASDSDFSFSVGLGL